MLRQASRLTRNTPLQRQRLLSALFVVTGVVTFISLRSLSHIVERHEQETVKLNDEGSMHTKGWQAVAELTLVHVEELSQGRGEGVGGGGGGGAGNGRLFSKYLKYFEGTSGQKVHLGAPTRKVSPEEESNSFAGGQCTMMPNTDYFGEALVWGYANKKESAGECCTQCLNYKPKEGEPECNLWVYCGDKEKCGHEYKDCWIKHLLHAQYMKPTQGANVSFTSGLVNTQSIYDAAVEQTMQSSPGNDRSYHVVTTAAGPPVHWQARIHYYWYKKKKEECERAGPCDMGGFTRILHSGEPDDLMDEIPTFVAQALPPNFTKNGDSSYVVVNRPYAFVQWVNAVEIKEKYILMSEPDHVFIKPLPNFMQGENPASYPFFYMEPQSKDNSAIIAKLFGYTPPKLDLEEHMYPIGNSPTMLRFDDMKKLAQPWMDMTLKIFHDKDAKKAWGWIQEMYAFTLSAYQIGLKNMSMIPNMMAQPPWDDKLNITAVTPFYIIHFTYGMDYTLDGVFTPGKIGAWRFDKRDFAYDPLRKITGVPKNLQNDLVKLLMDMFNEAMENIPCWEEYTVSKVRAPCGNS